MQETSGTKAGIRRYPAAIQKYIQLNRIEEYEKSYYSKCIYRERMATYASRAISKGERMSNKHENPSSVPKPHEEARDIETSTPPDYSPAVTIIIILFTVS